MKAIKKNMSHRTLNSSDRKILHCKKCGGEFSGHASDYWDYPDDWEFVCECGGEMELVKKIVTITYV
jgi:hypothetical protein